MEMKKKPMPRSNLLSSLASICCFATEDHPSPVVTWKKNRKNSVHLLLCNWWPYVARRHLKKKTVTWKMVKSARLKLPKFSESCTEKRSTAITAYMLITSIKIPNADVTCVKNKSIKKIACGEESTMSPAFSGEERAGGGLARQPLFLEHNPQKNIHKFFTGIMERMRALIIMRKEPSMRNPLITRKTRMRRRTWYLPSLGFRLGLRVEDWGFGFIPRKTRMSPMKGILFFIFSSRSPIFSFLLPVHSLNPKP